MPKARIVRPKSVKRFARGRVLPKRKPKFTDSLYGGKELPEQKKTRTVKVADPHDSVKNATGKSPTRKTPVASQSSRARKAAARAAIRR